MLLAQETAPRSDRGVNRAGGNPGVALQRLQSAPATGSVVSGVAPGARGRSRAPSGETHGGLTT